MPRAQLPRWRWIFSHQTLRTQKGLLNYSNPKVDAEMGVERCLPDGNPHRRVLIIITHLPRVKTFLSPPSMLFFVVSLSPGLLSLQDSSCLHSSRLFSSRLLLLASLLCEEIPCKVKGKNWNENEI